MISLLPQEPGCFRTASGITVNILDPKAEMIDLHDIVQGLAYKAHFSGQINQYFSIADHSLLTQRLVECDHPSDYELQLIALLHDASEAYIGDMISPLKSLLPEFKKLEINLLKVIFEKFGLPYNRLPEIKTYDITAQNYEAAIFYDMKDSPYYRYTYMIPRYATPDESARKFKVQVQITRSKI